MYGVNASSNGGQLYLAAGNTTGASVRIGTQTTARWDFIDDGGHMIPVTSGALDIGSAAYPIRKLYADSIDGDGLVYDNDSYAEWRNAGDTDNIGGIKVDSNDDTIINSNASNSIFLQPAGTKQWEIESGGNLMPAISGGPDIGSVSKPINYIYATELRYIDSEGEGTVWKIQDITENNATQWVGEDDDNNLTFRVRNTGTSGCDFMVGSTIIDTPFTGKHLYTVASGQAVEEGNAMILNDDLELEVASSVSLSLIHISEPTRPY